MRRLKCSTGLRHGFGLGEGTVAEGWIDRAVSFWEQNRTVACPFFDAISFGSN